jgi:hypothetical protein
MRVFWYAASVSFAAALIARVAFGGETPTEWEARTAPTSVEMFQCKNGRAAHVKCERRNGIRIYWRDGRLCSLRIWCPGPVQ